LKLADKLGLILINRSCGTYPTTRHFFARFLRGPGTPSPGYSARMMPMRGSMVSPAMLSDQHQRLDRRAPCEAVMLALRQLGDVGRGVAEGPQLAVAGAGSGSRARSVG